MPLNHPSNAAESITTPAYFNRSDSRIEENPEIDLDNEKILSLNEKSKSTFNPSQKLDRNNIFSSQLSALNNHEITQLNYNKRLIQKKNANSMASQIFERLKLQKNREINDEYNVDTLLTTARQENGKNRKTPLQESDKPLESSRVNQSMLEYSRLEL